MKIYPHSAEPSKCRLCRQPIIWMLTYPNRKRAPLDPPVKTHSLEFDADGHQIATLDSPTHFETCTRYEPNPVKPVLKEQARLF